MSASPQLEDGFIRIANELMDAILSGPLTGREMLVMFAIIRKTYGFNKKEDDVSASQIGKLCQLGRPHVTEALNSLARKNIITKRPGIHGCIVGVQKNHAKWTDDPLSGTRRTPHADVEGNHYTYTVTNEATGEFYIGVRTCKCMPAQDRYKGSGQWVDTVDKRSLKKVITGNYATREEAHQAEQDRIRESIGNPLMKNIILFSVGTPPCTDSVQGVPKNDPTSTDSVQVASTESVHTKDTVPKDIKQKTSPREEITFKKWMDNCKADDQDPIPGDDPVFAYADEMKLPIEFIRYAWVEFKRKYAPTGKRYKNWNQHFQNAIRENWYGIWYEKDDEWHLTTRGKQIEKETKARSA